MNARVLFEALALPVEIPSKEISFITEDSRTANENAVFVCIKGALADGHKYAASAYERGCRFFVAEQKLPLPEDAFVWITENTRIALARLACRLYDDPSSFMKVIGITGTKGKTTTAQMLAHILNQNGIAAGYIGTNGISYGEIRQVTANTTPDAVTLQKTLFEMKSTGIQAVIIEISSQALKQYRADGTVFDTVIFTNLFTDHIGPHEHPDFEDYKECKKRLFQDFSFKRAILNADDKLFEEFWNASATKSRSTCSSKAPSCGYYAECIRSLFQNGMPSVSFTLWNEDEKQTCHLPLIGAPNVYNAMLAMACAKEGFGIPLALSANALASVSVSGRSECIPLPNGACVIIDYAHNGESLRALLQGLRAYCPSRLLCLFGSVGDRTKGRRFEMGEVAASLCDLSFLTSDNPGREDPQRILDDIAVAFEAVNAPYIRIADREKAIVEALRQTKAGDILVLAGKGHETYQLIQNKKIPFFEKEIVENTVKSNLILFS